ncbi:MAG TPA: hypothetical protein VNJ54_11340 [Plantibacter sp.]|uniref:hypothetical protein n=1 Tax=Plantibacter sp. TaxID=1871045 RepID=UPI002D00E782|nr:hypothetical protein [Plantibacter sp.]
MASTTADERYTLKDLRKDTRRIAELTARARVSLNDAATIANRVAVESPVGLRFTFSEAIRTTAQDISRDIVEGETTPENLAEYASDLVKLVELAAAQVEEVAA